MSSPGLRIALPRAVIVVVCAMSVLMLLGPGCAPGVLPADILDPTAQISGGSGTPVTGLGGTGETVADGTAAGGGPSATAEGEIAVSGSEPAPDAGGNPVVAGAAASELPQPVLEVSPALMEFDASVTSRSLLVRNAGEGAMNYTVASDVAWATASPTSGTGTEEYQSVEILVNASGLSPGMHVGQIVVRTEDGQTQAVALRLSVAFPPTLELARIALDFGPTELTRTFTLRNGGDGTLGYTIESSDAWLIVTPPSGLLTGATTTIHVAINRDPLIVGPHQAVLTVRTGTGQAATIAVTAEKPVTSPRIIPWLELDSTDPERVSSCIEGLQIWQRVTDTVVVHCGSHPWLFTQLREQFPNLKIIGGITTSYRLGHNSFDSLAGWQLLAQDVAATAAATGQPRVLLDSELALRTYLNGDYEIDLEQVRQGLSYLPSGVEIIWYPGVEWQTSTTPPGLLAKTTALAQLVNDEIDCRLVDFSYCEPDALTCPAALEARAIADGMAYHPIIPIVYFGYPRFYWNYDGVHQVMEEMAGRPDALFYPGSVRWVEAAQEITARLSQNPPAP